MNLILKSFCVLSVKKFNEMHGKSNLNRKLLVTKYTIKYEFHSALIYNRKQFCVYKSKAGGRLKHKWVTSEMSCFLFHCIAYE